jgi:UDP-glucose 4-epimerase
MKIAIIGASGFIGKNLTENLIRKGYDVIPVFFSREVYYPRSVRINDFLRNREAVEIVIFAAGNSNHLIKDPEFLISVEKDTKYIQRVFGEVSFSKAILLSSAAVYYGYKGVVTEETCPRPTTNYGISKRIAEMVFEKAVLERKMTGIVLRLTHVFGKGEKESRLFPSIAKAIFTKEPLRIRGNGESYINPISVEFLNRTIEYFITHFRAEGVDYFNVGSSEPLRVIDVVKKLLNFFHFTYVFEGEETQQVDFLVNVDKIENIIGRPNFYDDAVVYINHLLKNFEGWQRGDNDAEC